MVSSLQGMCVLLFCEHKRKDWFAPYASGTELQPKSVSRAVSRGVVWRERVGTAFPHLFHVLLQNESEAVLKRLFFGCVPKPFFVGTTSLSVSVRVCAC